MDEKRKPIESEVPKYKKKSNRRGTPRADHKHEYKTVLLHRFYESNVFPGKTCTLIPTKVCTICGRVGDTDFSMYEHVDMESDYLFQMKKRVIKDADSLEKWYVNDFFDKVAKKMEGEVPDAKIYHW